MIDVQNNISLPVEREASCDEALLAMGKSLADTRIKKLRDSVSSCVVDINHTINIKGKFVVHADYKQKQVNKVCPWTFLKVAWNKMNAATRNACVQEAQQMIKDGVQPDLTELKQITKDAVQAIENNTTQTSKGPCKFNGVIWVSE